MKQQSFAQDLTNGHVGRSLLRFSIPFLIANVLQALYNVVDMMIVGWFCGSVGISAVNIGSQFTMLGTSLVIGLAVGGTVLIAQYLGAGEDKMIVETIGTLLTIFLVLALTVTVVGVLAARPLLSMVNTPPESYGQSLSYLRITMGGMAFIFGYNAISAILRGMGDSKRPMVFVAISTITNIMLDLLSVGVMDMGAAGAALATIISQAIAFVLAVVYLVRNKFVFDFKLKSFRINRNIAGLLFKIGIPSSVQMAVTGISFLFIISMMNGYGLIASAVSGIGQKVDSFAVLPAIAISSAVSSMVGQNIGARRIDRVKETVFSGIKIVLVIALSILMLIQVFPETIVRLFDSSPEVVTEGVRFIRIASIGYMLASIMFIFNGLATGTGYTTFSLLNSLVIAVFARVPLALLLSKALGLGLLGIYIAMGISPVTGLALGFWFYISNRWTHPRIKLKESVQQVICAETESSI